MITEVAIPYQAYQLTHSSLVVGAIGAVELAPLVLFAFVGGAIADWADRRKVVVYTQAVMLLTAIVLFVNAVWVGGSHRTAALVLLFAIGALRAAVISIQRPSTEAILPRLVDRDELVAAGALGSIQMNTAIIAGPALGGVLIAAFGLPAAYAVDVLTFFLSLGLLASVGSVPAPEGAEAPSLRGIREGIRYALSRQELIGTYTVDMVAMFFGMPLALFPALADRLGGPAVLGLLYAAPSIGSLLASVTSGWAGRVHRHGLAIVVAACAWGLAIAAFGLAPTVPLALFFLILAGAADMVSGIFRMAVWNQTIPDALRGRLAGIELISYSSGPALSGVESGVVAQLFSPAVSVVSGGLICVVGALALAAVLPRFLHYDNRVAPAEPATTRPA